MRNDLCFCSTTRGGFGIVREGAQIPESHILLASPAACGRHTSISSISLGYKNRVSYYIFDESELIFGTLEDGISQAAKELLEYVQPKVLLVYVCCVMYIAGFDESRLKNRLELENPGLVVQICEMNPISVGTSSPPAVTMQKRIYELLEFSGERRRAINFIGNDYPIDHECEIYFILKQLGIQCNHISEMSTFDEFRSMGTSLLNIVLSQTAVQAAELMNNYIPHVKLLPEYDLNGVDLYYAQLSSLLEESIDTSKFRQNATCEIEKTLKILGRKRIAVGSSATSRPFALAKALTEYGFNVTSVFIDQISKSEIQNMNWLLSNVSNFQIFNVESPEMVGRIGTCGNVDISIGYNAAYFSGSEVVVDVVSDKGMFGYYGIVLMMRSITEALSNSKNLENMIDETWLVV